MPAFQVVLKPSVEKDLRRLPPAILSRIFARLEALGTDPFPAQSIRLAGTERLFRVRVGDYRIIYGVEPAAARIIVHYVRHRGRAYKDL